MLRQTRRLIAWLLVELIRLAWLGMRWLWRRSTRREQTAATTPEAG
jgi:hypothetical protein